MVFNGRKYHGKPYSFYCNIWISSALTRNGEPRIPKLPSSPMNPRRNFPDQGQFRPKHTFRLTLHSLIQTYLQ
jgi:hypothetical protein